MEKRTRVRFTGDLSAVDQPLASSIPWLGQHMKAGLTELDLWRHFRVHQRITLLQTSARCGQALSRSPRRIRPVADRP